MIRRRPLVISVLAVTSCAVVAALLAWYLLQLPDPRTANREGLFRWLVLRDLSAEPRDVQLALVDRLQGELRSGLKVGADNVSLGPAYRERLQKNAEHLKHVWFTSRVEQYARCAPEKRMLFLEEQIETIGQWPTMEIPVSAGEANSPGRVAVRFFQQIETWIEQAAGREREQMIKAVQDGTVCWLAMRDLAEQPPLVRHELALRIVRELNTGMKLDEILLDLTPPQREKLFANGEMLLEAWLHDQARRFAELHENERAAYVDQRIDEVVRWGVLEVLASPSGAAVPSGNEPTTAASAQAAGLARFVTLVDQWIERAPPEERPKLTRLVAQVQRQLLWRQFRPK